MGEQEARTYIDNVIAEYVKYAEDAAYIKAKLDEIKTTIRALGGPGFKHETPTGVRVAVRSRREFSAVMAEDVVPEELLAQCRETKVAPAKAREVLPPWLYDRCMVDKGDASVVIT